MTPNAASAPPIRIIRASDLLTFNPPVWIVKPILEAGARTMLFGPWGSGKTFVGLDIALSISTARQWADNQPPIIKTVRGPVLYICAEGQRSLGRRVQGWLQHYGFTQADIEDWFFAIGTPVQLIDPATRKVLAEQVVATMPDMPVNITVDTLAWCLAGVKENENSDMQLFLNALAELQTDLAARYKSTAEPAGMLIHHPGKNPAAGPRGAYALPAGLDGLFELEALEERQALFRINKIKDGEKDQALKFDLKVHTLLGPDGKPLVDEDGDPITTCVAVCAGEWHTGADADEQTPTHREAVVAALKEQSRPMRRGELIKATGIKESTLKRTLNKMMEHGELTRLSKDLGYALVGSTPWVKAA